MRIFSTIVIALRALRRNLMRSMLTALGMIIGVGAVITVVAMGSGTKAQVEAQIAGLGDNLITVIPGVLTTGGVRGGWSSASSLTIEDTIAIKQEIAGVTGTSPETRDRVQVIAGGLNWNTSAQGVSADYAAIRSWSVAEGDFFSEQDLRTNAKVCVIGKTVADQLYPGLDPVGQNIRARNIPLRIVGVMASKGFNAYGQDQDDFIMVPYTTAMKRIIRRDRINQIMIQAASADILDRVQAEVGDLLQQRRGGRDPDYTVRNQEEIAKARNATNESLSWLLTGIALVSLLVGGIGIMNIMLVSVTERTREIGIRLAIGAHGKDVLLQFLTEAIVLSVLGGGIGIACGIGASQFLAHYKGWLMVIPTEWVAFSFLISAGVGIAFGFFPAMKAAQLDPIDALRYE
ncbi:putative ABC transport system permease protein [Ereboglobus sp. PH5-5]|uniref:ABC transporter permease n=1 Tax=Ereboglobus sp. PH5-5 TaxID=2940529 RepID=UPI002406B649|nr:ABC transporter permease [Ereboglobus sp. PH5-5]MDF9834357.1 putative ABC transport system permease protein [Ereboglobus sp. PH5-5]